jgi:cyclopropane fatty-acyl-phospholipid synthase-like methyltransferase
MAAALGHEAVGVDQSAEALRQAGLKARDRGLKARFLRHDACRLAELGESFDTVLDCGLFHILTDGPRAEYVDSLRAAARPGARYFMLGLSDRQPGDWGPRRLTRDEIATAFADGWQVDSIEPAVLHITPDPAGVAAWLASLTRR